LEVAVQDDGVGISTAQQSRLFAQFCQVTPPDPQSPQQSSGGGSSGLGLRIAERLVKAMHGADIEVDSTPGQGSTFSFFVLCDAVDTNKAASAELSALAGPLCDAYLTFVGQSPFDTTCGTWLGLLQFCSSRVRACRTVEEATRASGDAHATELALVDLDAPGLDFEAIQLLLRRSQLFQSRLLLLWSTRSAEAVSSAATATCTRLRKPFRTRQLLRAMSECIASSSKPAALDAQQLISRASAALPIHNVAQQRPLRILLVEDNVSWTRRSMAQLICLLICL
jgi:hypothetical protein